MSEEQVQIAPETPKRTRTKVSRIAVSWGDKVYLMTEQELASVKPFITPSTPRDIGLPVGKPMQLFDLHAYANGQKRK